MTRDEALTGLSTTCHLLLGLVMGHLTNANPDKSTDECWEMLKPHRRHVYACNVALGLPTLAPPYVDPEDMPDFEARHPTLCEPKPDTQTER
jgi:hypothetical protein